MTELRLEYLGTHWEWSGSLFTMEHPDGREASVGVDSLGKTWVAIRVVPEGGFFHSKCVEAYRARNGATRAGKELANRGFTNKRIAPFAGRVRERLDDPYGQT